MIYDIRFVDIYSVNDELKDKVRCWRNKERIRKSMLTQHVISVEEHFNWIERLKYKTNNKFWIVFVKDTPIGSVYLQDINYNKLSAEWGFYIGEDAYTGKGISKHILYKLLKYFFDVMKFNVLLTKVVLDNTIALNIYRRFNFTEVGTSLHDDGREVVTLSFSISDWDRCKRDFAKCMSSKEQ